MQLACEKEKSNNKDQLIKSLNMSIDLVNQNKDLSIQQMHSQNVELKNALDLSQSQALTENKDKESSGSQDKYTKNIEDLNAKIIQLERKVKEKDDHIAEFQQKFKINMSEIKEEIELDMKTNIKEKEEHITQLEAKISQMNTKLSEFTLDTNSCQNPSESFVFLNCTTIPSIKLITLHDSEPFGAVFEDIPSAGPGWMVIQRRFDGSVLMKNEDHFFIGCGDLGGEFWIGSEKLHKLTASRRHELYIQLVDFDNVVAFARYDHFIIGDSKKRYKLLSLGKYSGNAGDALLSHINKDFQGDGYCGWWDRTDCNLNGNFYDCKRELRDWDGIWWGRWNMGKRYSLKSCKMLIRPKT
ncbi:angiopoietin-related protein 7-like [Drosophila subpulchrella]|uniref:angiopoietin-related protein 7-like n=1 Tax=Drosophila subpulchrella TaxID=1486046 RepID=UPI0018A12ED8|nr:angiopoietin-related protein 7-like [Drosophila subpulchrella]